MPEIVVKKWGNSLAFRIPSAYAKEWNLAVNQKLDTTFSGSQMTIRPKYTLDDMMKGMDESNRHEEQIDVLRGKETW